MQSYKFSIITVCLNAEDSIKHTIGSVLRQSYNNYEYIIVDGNSHDGTIEIIKDFKTKFNGRMKLVSESDSGIYNALNKGISLSEGDIIGIINSDDWYDKETLKIINNEYNKTKNHVFHGVLRQWKDGKIRKILGRSHDFIDEAMIMHPTVFVPKWVYLKYGGFDESYKLASDYEFFLRLCKFDVKFKFIEKIIANMSFGGLSAKRAYLREIETLKIRYKYGLRSMQSRYILTLYLFGKYFLRYYIDHTLED